MTNSTRVWEAGIIFKTLAGSWLYGTNTDVSDIDIRGVCVMPKEALLGLSPFEQYQPEKSTAKHPTSDEEVPADTVIYGLNKFAMLALDCNPNIIEILFAPRFGRNCYYTTATWDFLISHRQAFISKKARHSFSGYAFGQLERIERHHKWLVGEIPLQPKPEDFGGVAKLEGGYSWGDNQNQQNYHTAHKKYMQYCEWVKNRNPARRGKN